MKKRFAFNIAFALILAACAPAAGGGEPTPIMITAEVSTVVASGSGGVGGGASVTPEPAGSPTPVPTLAGGLSTTELKYKVLEAFPDLFFCDPDFYPIARAEESDLAIQRFPEIEANTEMFQAILVHNGLRGAASFTDEQKLLIYREFKKLNAIYFEFAGNKYSFQIQTGSEGQQGSAITATIDSRGKIDVLQKQRSFPTCPICLAVGTLIATPRGAVPVEDLKVGDSVWTLDEAGERVPAALLKTGRVRVPATHRMIHLALSDGRELWASPGHRTADGRVLAALNVGDVLDGAQILRAEYVHYEAGFTFDVLPAGATGDYWANGILMGSTLTR